MTLQDGDSPLLRSGKHKLSSPDVWIRQEDIDQETFQYQDSIESKNNDNILLCQASVICHITYDSLKKRLTISPGGTFPTSLQRKVRIH